MLVQEAMQRLFVMLRNVVQSLGTYYNCTEQIFNATHKTCVAVKYGGSSRVMKSSTGASMMSRFTSFKFM